MSDIESMIALGKHYGVQVVGIQCGKQRINIPSASTLILPGNQIQVIGLDKQLTDFGNAIETMSAEVAPQKTQEEMTLHRLLLTSNSPLIDKNIKESGIRDTYQGHIVGVEANIAGLEELNHN